MDGDNRESAMRGEEKTSARTGERRRGEMLPNLEREGKGDRREKKKGGGRFPFAKGET